MDRYDLQARHLPVAVALLPVAVLAVAIIPDLAASPWLPAFGMVGLSGVYWILGRYARARGRVIEIGLYESWGGKPTTALLRHRDPRLSSFTKEIYHNRLRKLGKPFVIPTVDEEISDPAKADSRYEAAMDELRRRAKASKDPVVLRENINYGGARNLLALKPLGIGVALLCLMILIVTAGERSRWIPDLLRMTEIVCAVVLVADLLGWILIVKADLVKHQADAYAYALIESAETSGKRKPSKA